MNQRHHINHQKQIFKSHHAFSGSLKPVSFSLMLALGSALILSAQASDIQVDSAAPKSQQPTILPTANGLPQVNIQTPTAAGVSVNQYQRFDVDSKGVILNNSRRNVQTQLGGWIQGNPFLATGEAKIIVNQINSQNPSLLNGYVEVGGKRAEVVLLMRKRRPWRRGRRLFVVGRWIAFWCARVKSASRARVWMREMLILRGF